jgi:hypothetical protein
MNLRIHLAPSTIALLLPAGRDRPSAAHCLRIPVMLVASTS